MSEIPWWALPLVAVVFALAGAGVTLLVSARDEYARSRAKRTKRWYAERKEADEYEKLEQEKAAAASSPGLRREGSSSKKKQ